MSGVVNVGVVNVGVVNVAQSCTGVGARDPCASKNCWDTKRAPKAPPLASLSQLHVFVFFIYMGM